MFATRARGWAWATLAFAAALAGASLWLHLPQHRERPDVPMPAGAYLTGGVPASDAAVERVLGEDLAAFEIETDRDAHGSSAAARTRPAHAAALRGAPAMLAYGDGLATAWRALLDALDRWDATLNRRSVERLTAAAHEVSEQLAALGLGYHLDAAAEDGHAVVFAYRVVDVRYEHAGDARVRVLALRRLDRLSVAHALLGLQSEDGGDPVVLLDQIDDTIATHLATPEWFELGDDEWASSPRGGDLCAAAGAAIARELGRAHRSPAAILAASVRRHEARHAIDLAAGAPPPTPPALARYEPEPGGTFALRANAELAAYLSQIASDPDAPQLALWNLANLAFRGHLRGRAEQLVAAVVIEALARHLGVPGRGPAVANGVVDRTRLAQIALPLAALDDAALRRAAFEAWLDLYHAPLVPVVDD